MTHEVRGFAVPDPQGQREDEVPRFALAPRDHEALREVFALLLTPLDWVSPDTWRTEVGRCCAELLGAERSAFQLEAPGIRRLHSEDYSQSTIESYIEHYHAVDVGRIRREELGLEVWNRWRLHGAKFREFFETEIHQDFLAPNRIFDSMGLTVQIRGASNPATLFFHREKSGTPQFGERGVSLLHLLLPAFTAGVRDLARYSHQRESLTSHFDSLTEGIRICDLNGRIVHQNPAFTSMLAREPAVAKLEKAIFDIAHALTGFSRQLKGSSPSLLGKLLTRDVHGDTASYEVRGTFLGRDLLGAELRIAISLHQLAPHKLPSDATIQERFGLTARELEIAWRLARGESTKELAQSCGISLHTARHHTENIFHKLGVRTRSQVGPKLRGR
jgi:DNA-binding CsgD family transcriptional regulator